MAELEIIFKGQDNLGNVVKDVKGQMNDLTDTTNKAKESGTGFFSGILQTAGGFLAANVLGGITSQFTGFISSAISDTKEANLIFAQTQAAIESTGGAAGFTADQIADMASSISAAQGLSLFDDDDIQKGDNLLLTFTNISDTLPEAQQAMVDMATAMHTDVSAGAIQLGKALNDPIAGISALSRVGVTFTNEQKDQIKVLQESGDMAGAQRIILAELNKEFGGSAAAAAKADGGMAQFKAQLGDVSKTIGGALLPVLNELTSLASTYLLPIFQNLSEEFATNLPAAIDTVKSFFADAASIFTDTGGTTNTVLSDIRAAGSSVSIAFQTQLMPTLKILGEALFPAVSAACQILSGFYTDILKPAIQLVWSILTETLFPALSDLAGWLRDVLPPTVQLIADFLTGTFFPALRQVYDFVRVNVIPILGTLRTWFSEYLPPAIQTISDFLTGTLFPALDKVWQFINANVMPVLSALADLITATVVTAFRLLGETWTNVVQPALATVGSFIEENIMPAFNRVAGILNDTLSPAFSSLRTNVLDPVVNAFENISGAVQTVIDWINRLIEAINSVHVPSSLRQQSPSPLERSLLDVGSAAFRAEGSIVRVNQALASTPSSPGSVTQNTTNTNVVSKPSITIVQQPGQNSFQLATVAVRAVTKQQQLRRA